MPTSLGLQASRGTDMGQDQPATETDQDRQDWALAEPWQGTLSGKVTLQLRNVLLLIYVFWGVFLPESLKFGRLHSVVLHSMIDAMNNKEDILTQGKMLQTVDKAEFIKS